MLVETLSLLIHADAKVGKTTLAATSPTPILALDAEGGWKFLPVRTVSWNPNAGPPPVWDGTWDVCIVIVRDWATVTNVFAWLSMGQHNFRSLVVDSITEIQRRCKQNLGTNDMTQQLWGRLLTDMDFIIRGLRDLTLHPTNPIQVAVFVAETRQSGMSGKWRPYMQGQIDIALPYWTDIVGYLYATQEIDANQQYTGRQVRNLLIAPNPQFEAGERVQGRLPAVIQDPNITTMLLAVYPHLVQQPTVATNGQEQPVAVSA